MKTSTKRILAQGLGPALLLAAALSLPTRADAQYYPRPYGYGSGTIDGFVTAQGGRCPTLRDHRTNRSFYLVGNTRDLRPGDHVVLRERGVRTNACGVQAPTLEVLQIRTIWAGSQHRSAYFDAARDGDLDRFIARNRYRGGWFADRYAYRQNGSAPNDQYGQYGRDDDRYAPPQGPGPNRPYDDRYDRNRPPYDDQNGQYDNRDNDRNDRYEDQGQIQQEQIPDDRSGDNRQVINVDGTLDYTGECPSIRTGNGSYDLAGDLGNYHDGDQVHVTGFLSGSSSCGGTALEIQEIRRR